MFLKKKCLHKVEDGKYCNDLRSQEHGNIQTVQLRRFNYVLKFVVRFFFVSMEGKLRYKLLMCAVTKQQFHKISVLDITHQAQSKSHLDI